ncbi:MAG: PepSY domain-containing protein [Alphaproteobacteria bacterium]|nr:PepSY domain-containing protein [Alphaproteobacteria bacterium]
MLRKFLFQLHLWSGLILGVVFVAIGLSGSIAMFWPVFQAPPAVQVVASTNPTLDKGLAAARDAVSLPQNADTTITLPETPDQPVHIHFGAPLGSGRNLPLPEVATDPASGRVLATYNPEAPAWFRAIEGFHSHLSIPGGRFYEGWLGIIMALLGLTGLYLWWPKAGQWQYGFIVRRKAKGLRFHRELHGAVGIWTLAIYMIVTVTGIGICFPAVNRSVITFLAGGGAMTPRYAAHTPLVAAPAGATRIGPDAALAAARKASDLPVVQLLMPGRPNQAISATFGPASMVPVYIDPYRGTALPNPSPPPSRIDNIQRMMGRLHEAIGLGTPYTVLVFISGLAPLLFFVTGLIMWLKKRRNRLAMNQPLPESVMETD